MEDESVITVFCNGRFFVNKNQSQVEPEFAECMHVKDGRIQYIGSPEDATTRKVISEGAIVQDLKRHTVLPAFVDGHAHLLLFGQSLRKLDLEDCESLEDIRNKIKIYAEANPKAKRILCHGWMHSMTNGEADTKMLEGLDPRPIFIDSKDLHSSWCNEAALEELHVSDMKNPVGGTIHRYPDGRASGLISESANITLVWPHLARAASLEDRVTALKSALNAYTQAGYTGVCDMAMDEHSWEALVQLQRDEPLPIRIAAYWLITPSANKESNLKQVDHAISVREKYNENTSPNLRIVGIKLICDGVIDACTATLLEPYSSDVSSPDPLWTVEMLKPVVEYADKAGLQCALHAIGDQAIRNAIDTIERFGTPGRRHRIEHLELCSKDDAPRLGKLNITASIQAVHADPTILKEWPRLLGEQRCSRAFAYGEFLEGGAPLALGTDAPTAPLAAMPNIYTATTRRSAREPDSKVTVNENYALPLCATVSSYTHGSAYSCFLDHLTGRLATGLMADFVVVDMAWTTEDLLQAKIKETWYCGKQVYDSSNAKTLGTHVLLDETA
jgi:predicted amidohydrolase YtcJ